MSTIPRIEVSTSDCFSPDIHSEWVLSQNEVEQRSQDPKYHNSFKIPHLSTRSESGNKDINRTSKDFTLDAGYNTWEEVIDSHSPGKTKRIINFSSRNKNPSELDVDTDAESISLSEDESYEFSYPSPEYNFPHESNFININEKLIRGMLKSPLLTPEPPRLTGNRSNIHSNSASPYPALTDSEFIYFDDPREMTSNFQKPRFEGNIEDSDSSLSDNPFVRKGSFEKTNDYISKQKRNFKSNSSFSEFNNGRIDNKTRNEKKQKEKQYNSKIKTKVNQFAEGKKHLESQNFFKLHEEELLENDNKERRNKPKIKNAKKQKSMLESKESGEGRICLLFPQNKPINLTIMFNENVNMDDGSENEFVAETSSISSPKRRRSQKNDSLTENPEPEMDYKPQAISKISNINKKSLLAVPTRKSKTKQTAKNIVKVEQECLTDLEEIFIEGENQTSEISSLTKPVILTDFEDFSGSDTEDHIPSEYYSLGNSSCVTNTKDNGKVIVLQMRKKLIRENLSPIHCPTDYEELSGGDESEDIATVKECPLEPHVSTVQIRNIRRFKFSNDEIKDGHLYSDTHTDVEDVQLVP